MKVEISVPEAREIFNEIQQQPEKLFEMIRFDIQQTGEFRGHHTYLLTERS